MTEEIILFDIPSKPPCKTWSYNTWRTRMLLNYKGLKYRTEWLEYPNIRTRLEGHVSNDGSDRPYTVPAILLPDGTYFMHSRRILEAINLRYPDPPITYQTPHLDRLWVLLEPLMDAFRGIYVPGVAENILNAGSLGYFHHTRTQDLGMPLDELKAKHGGESAYLVMEPFLTGITALLGEDEQGPFFGGEEVAHVDFVWAGILLFMRRLGGSVFQQVMEHCGESKRHLDLLEAVSPWTQRDD